MLLLAPLIKAHLYTAILFLPLHSFDANSLYVCDHLKTILTICTNFCSCAWNIAAERKNYMVVRGCLFIPGPDLCHELVKRCSNSDRAVWFGAGVSWENVPPLLFKSLALFLFISFFFFFCPDGLCSIFFLHRQSSERKVLRGNLKMEYSHTQTNRCPISLYKLCQT